MGENPWTYIQVDGFSPTLICDLNKNEKKNLHAFPFLIHEFVLIISDNRNEKTFIF